jgi:hypothetical protein
MPDPRRGIEGLMRLTPLLSLGFLVACGASDGAPPDAGASDDADSEPDATDDPARNDLLDQTFGDGGVVTLDVAHFTRIEDLAIEDDGSLYYTRVPSSGGSYGYVCRLTSDGRRYLGFGGQGWNCFSTEGHTALARVGDGIVVAESYSNALSIARYSPLGERDMTFGGDGSVDFESDPLILVRAWRVARTASDGVAVLADWSEYMHEAPWIITLDGDGTILGESTAVLPGVITPHEIVPLPSGALIALGYTTTGLGDPIEVLAGYQADASPDPTFGDNGQFWQSRLRGPTEIGPLGDGVWSVASEKGTWVGRAIDADSTAHDAVELHPALRPGDAVSLGIRLRDGRWLLVGFAAEGADEGPVLWLLSAEGTPVSDFGDGGRLRFALPSLSLRIDRIEEAADGAVVMAFDEQGDQAAYLVRVRP